MNIIKIIVPVLFSIVLIANTSTANDCYFSTYRKPKEGKNVDQVNIGKIKFEKDNAIMYWSSFSNNDEQKSISALLNLVISNELEFLDVKNFTFTAKNETHFLDIDMKVQVTLRDRSFGISNFCEIHVAESFFAEGKFYTNEWVPFEYDQNTFEMKYNKLNLWNSGVVQSTSRGESNR